MMKLRRQLEVTGLNLLLKQSHLAQIAQDHIQTDFEDGDSTSLGNLCWSFTPAKVKKCFLCSEGAFCVSVCACCFWAPLKRGLSSLHRLLSYLPKILIYIDQIHPSKPSLLQGEQFQLCLLVSYSRCFRSPNDPGSPLLDSFQYSMSLLY